ARARPALCLMATSRTTGRELATPERYDATTAGAVQLLECDAASVPSAVPLPLIVSVKFPCVFLFYFNDSQTTAVREADLSIYQLSNTEYRQSRKKFLFRSCSECDRA